MRPEYSTPSMASGEERPCLRSVLRAELEQDRKVMFLTTFRRKAKGADPLV